jgi:hypothetical protein
MRLRTPATIAAGVQVIIRPIQHNMPGRKLGSQLLGRDGEHVIASTDGHEMTGSLDLMP